MHEQNLSNDEAMCRVRRCNLSTRAVRSSSKRRDGNCLLCKSNIDALTHVSPVEVDGVSTRHVGRADIPLIQFD